MAVVYATALKTARLNEVIAAIDAGTGPGKLKIGTTGMASVLATIPMADPCGSASGDVLTFDCDPAISDTSADATGTAAAAVITDSDDNVIVSGLTVGTSGADIVLDSVSITAGQTVTIVTATITHG